jgi:predicted nucleotidyltransferase
LTRERLLPEQVDALYELRRVSLDLSIDIVVVGAIALRVWLPDIYRQTEDVDVAVALDLHALDTFITRLLTNGWRPDARWEQRWHSTLGARVDILPIGLRALRERKIEWPRAETVMRLVGWDYAFKDAVDCDLATGLMMRVPPLHVLTLLKIGAYLDDPVLREKDLHDVLVILDKYSEEGDRRFSEAVLDERLDYDEAGAFLLGQDLRSLCARPDEESEIRLFIERVAHQDFLVPVQSIRARARGDEESGEGTCLRQLIAFARGFTGQWRSGALKMSDQNLVREG